MKIDFCLMAFARVLIVGLFFVNGEKPKETELRNEVEKFD